MRRGVALLAALMVLAIAGTMLAAAYYAQAARAQWSLVAERSASLDGQVDLAVLRARAEWDSAARFSQATGSTDTLLAPGVDPAYASAAWVARLSSTTYWLAVRVRDLRDPSLQSRSGLLLAVREPAVPPPTDSAVPVDDFGEVTFGQLVAGATLSLPAGYVGGAPSGALVVAPAGAQLTGGAGRGVLVVDGDLTLSGAVNFTGAIIVRGRVLVSGPGAVVTGTLRSRDGVSTKEMGNIELRNNPAVSADVLWHVGRVLEVAERPWAPLP